MRGRERLPFFFCFASHALSSCRPRPPIHTDRDTVLAMVVDYYASVFSVEPLTEDISTAEDMAWSFDPQFQETWP